ncbi:MAG: histidine--tRNA ligase [Vicingaceae bacterium]
MKKIGIPKGMRDFSPQVMAKRNYIFDVLKKAFLLYGFEQIETPTMENRETLTGKYGEEGDRLIFNVLNSGEYLNKADYKAINDKNSSATTASISEKALRYDLTVPFARYVVQHQNEISFPFKRFQIQPVWRADRPQKGRYREFYQCDADIIGSDSLLNEVELIKLFDEVLSRLGLTDFSIKINNRKILTGIAELIGKPEMIVPITVAIDKLEKIGLEKVKAELTEKGLTPNELETIQPLFEIKGSTEEILSQLKDFLSTSEIAQQGIEELESMLSSLSQLQLKKAKVEIDVTLARGLDYYTGAIFEVVSNQVQMGSICGGGRYADLTGIFGLPNTSGVGVSFGADRIFDVMEELNLFPGALSAATQVLFVNFGAKEAAYCLPILERLRDEGIAAELYPDSAKLKKQMKYADQKQIPAVIMVGEDEMKSGNLSLKNMISGEQQKLTVDELLKQLKAEVKN